MNAIGKNEYKIGQKINTTSRFYTCYIRWFVSIQFVAVSVCGLSVCGRSGLWPFRFVAVTICGRFGLWPFMYVAV